MATVQRSPMKIQELLNLSQLGINPENINFGDLTMQSDKYICLLEGVGEQAQLVFLDISNPTKPLRRPFDYEHYLKTDYNSVIVNLPSRVLAERVGSRLNIIKLETETTIESQLKAHTMQEYVLFWKWINNDTIGVVTETAVYHWSIEGDSEPVKVFRFKKYESWGENETKILDYISDISNINSALIYFISQEKVRYIYLFSSDDQKREIFPSDAAALTEFKFEGDIEPSTLLCYVHGGTLHIRYIRESGDGDQAYNDKVVELFCPTREHVRKDVNENKFIRSGIAEIAILMQISQKFNIIYTITNRGNVYFNDLESGDCIYTYQMPIDTIFVIASHVARSEVVVVNKEGQLLSVSIDEEKIIHHIMTTSKNHELAQRLASRWNVTGPDEILTRQFNAYFDNAQYVEAAKLAANSLNGILRTRHTIRKFQLISTVENQTSPLLQYFQILLDQGDLNEFESLELCKRLLEGYGQIGKEPLDRLLNEFKSIGLCEEACKDELSAQKQLLEKWMKEDKLECSEELGDLVKKVNPSIALIAYFRSNALGKVIQCLAEMDPLDELVLYGKKADYANLLPLVLPLNVERGTLIAKRLVSEDGPLADIKSIVDVFLESNLEQPCASFLVDVLKRNLPDDGPLQTLCLEMNLATAPDVADTILVDQIFTHYNRAHIAKLCEKAGLLQTALENYENVSDIKRLVVQTNLLNHERLIAFFGKLSDEDSLDCLHAMLSSNITQNLELSIQIATKYHDRFSSNALINIFELYGGSYYFLQSIVKSSEDEEVHFKYIKVAYQAGQLDEVERMCRESNHIDLERVKNYLEKVNLTDQLPMFIVCGRMREMEAANPTT